MVYGVSQIQLMELQPEYYQRRAFPQQWEGHVSEEYVDVVFVCGDDNKSLTDILELEPARAYNYLRRAFRRDWEGHVYEDFLEIVQRALVDTYFLPPLPDTLQNRVLWQIVIDEVPGTEQLPSAILFDVLYLEMTKTKVRDVISLFRNYQLQNQSLISVINNVTL